MHVASTFFTQGRSIQTHVRRDERIYCACDMHPVCVWMVLCMCPELRAEAPDHGLLIGSNHPSAYVSMLGRYRIHVSLTDVPSFSRSFQGKV